MSTNSILLKLNATADILGGEVFFTDENGTDLKYNNTGLNPNAMYIRLEGSDNSTAYISANELETILNDIRKSTVDKVNQIYDALKDDTVSDADIEFIKSDLETKVNITEFTKLLNTVEDKADQSTIDSIIETINAKADKTVVQALKEAIDNKPEITDIEAVVERILKTTTIQEVTILAQDVDVLKNSISSLADKDVIDSINKKITELEQQINNKLGDTDLSIITSKIIDIYKRINNINTRLDATDNILSDKASTSYVNEKVTELNYDLVAVNNKLNYKADKADVIIKANKTDLDTVTKRVSNLISDVTELQKSAITTNNNIYDKLSEKADNKKLNEELNRINLELKNKANASVANDVASVINSFTRISEHYKDKFIELKQDILDLECELNNISINCTSSNKDLVNSINACNDRIDAIKDNINTQAEQLKYPSIRILSTREYNRLTRVPSYIDYYSPYYIYPDILYFVVDFNKPKALYIGDVLIAKAEIKGSIGFAYTFPISF